MVCVVSTAKYITSPHWHAVHASGRNMAPTITQICTVWGRSATMASTDSCPMDQPSTLAGQPIIYNNQLAEPSRGGNCIPRWRRQLWPWDAVGQQHAASACVWTLAGRHVELRAAEDDRGVQFTGPPPCPPYLWGRVATTSPQPAAAPHKLTNNMSNHPTCHDTTAADPVCLLLALPGRCGCCCCLGDIA